MATKTRNSDLILKFIYILLLNSRFIFARLFEILALYSKSPIRRINPPIIDSSILCSKVTLSLFVSSFTFNNTFVSNSGIFGKVYFPRIIIPLSKVIAGLIKFFIQLFQDKDKQLIGLKYDNSSHTDSTF